MSEVLSFKSIVPTWTVSAVQSCGSITWNTISKSADPLVAFDRAIGEVIGRYALLSRSGDKQ